jgi:GST-like protein
MSKPIDFYYWPTPNGWKVSILLEELGIDYNTVILNIGRGDQFTPEFLAINPNHRMPAIVDHDVEGDPVSVFESGAILIYLAEKFDRFIARDPLLRKETLEWLFWQTGNLGPMAGQYSHFRNYAPEEEREGYARDRYTREYVRCLDVLERRLEGREFLVGDYSIADMMCWPWVLIVKAVGLSLDNHKRVARWRQAVKERPAVQRGVSLGKDERPNKPYDKEAHERLFNQGSARV